jgi:hypothetical protein|tara:strand:- start:441 stop:620 length:180 start_codon:yes stop_codon:yes gene_type:complete
MKDKLKNPFRPVKSVRTVYDKFYQKNVKEVQVQFKNEDPAWIPYDTLIAMMESEIEQWI